MDRMPSRGATGSLRSKRTVRSSTLTTPATRSRSSASHSSYVPPLVLKNGLSLFDIRPKLKITSSAFMFRVGVNRAFDWKRTPARRWKVAESPSGATDQDSARAGMMADPPRSVATSPS